MPWICLSITYIDLVSASTLAICAQFEIPSTWSLTSNRDLARSPSRVPTHDYLGGGGEGLDPGYVKGDERRS